jgi:hypothetical protein
VTAFAVLAGGFAWWSQRPHASATGTVQPDGTTVVDSRGIHIVTPAGWMVLATTPAALAKAAATLTSSNPQLAAALQGLQSQEHSDVLRFFAYGTPGPGGFTSSANVLVMNEVLPLNAVVAANSAELPQTGALNINESAIATATGEGEELTYHLPLKLPQGRTLMLNIDQVYEAKGSEIGILTMGTAGRGDGGVPAMISSFRLT